MALERSLQPAVTIFSKAPHRPHIRYFNTFRIVRLQANHKSCRNKLKIFTSRSEPLIESPQRIFES